MPSQSSPIPQPPGQRPETAVGKLVYEQAAAGSDAAKEEVIRAHMPLARKLARRYSNTSESLEDLEQVAYLALVKCVERYKPEAGPFRRYLVPSVLGELKRHFRDLGWTMHVPRSAKEHYLKVKAVIEAFTSTNGRMPTPREITEECNLDLDQVLEALEAQHAYSPQTFDAPAPGSTPDAPNLSEVIGGEDEQFAVVEAGAAVAPAFARLPEREQMILRLRFVEDLTQVEIAERIGISQMHVSRLIRDSIAKLRADIDGEAESSG